MGSVSPQILDGTRLGECLREGVQSAILNQNLQVSEFTEFYLVNLLLNFEKTESLFIHKEGRLEEEPLAMMLARALNGDTATQVRELKRLGDIALYVTGFFTDHVENGPVSIHYYVSMGIGAYASLAGQFTSEDVFEKLCTELSENFGGLAMVLKELSLNGEIKNNSALLNLYERWIRTGDEKLRSRLIKEGLIPTDKKISC